MERLKLSRPSTGTKNFIAKSLSQIALAHAPNLNEPAYNIFESFLKQVTDQRGVDLDKNTGDAIMIHIPNIKDITPQDTAELQKLKDLYETIYLDPQFITKENPYPDYMRDMYSKKAKPFEEFEKQYFLNKPEGFKTFIQEQTDIEFLESIKARVAGLDKCAKNTNPTITESDRKYYKGEYQNESEKLKIALAENSTLNDKQKNEILCKNIIFGEQTFNKIQEILSSEDKKDAYLKSLQKLYETYPEEKLYARTFLPANCFIDKNINFIEIGNLLSSPHYKDYRQYIFGIHSEIKYKLLGNYPIFYSAGGSIQQNFEYSCDKLVVWNLMLNILYTRCAVSNSNLLCHSRFIIPSRDFILLDAHQNKESG